MDVAHVEPAAVLGRIGRAVEVVDAAVGRLLVLVVDDRLDRPGERRIRAALADVVAGLDQVPEVVDHAGAREERALGVDGDAPGVARPLAEDLEDAGPGWIRKIAQVNSYVLPFFETTLLGLNTPFQP